MGVRYADESRVTDRFGGREVDGVHNLHTLLHLQDKTNNTFVHLRVNVSLPPTQTKVLYVIISFLLRINVRLKKIREYAVSGKTHGKRSTVLPCTLDILVQKTQQLTPVSLALGLSR